MKTFYYLKGKIAVVAILFITLVLVSCQKDKVSSSLEDIRISTASTVNLPLGDSLVIKAVAPAGLDYTSEWIVDGKLLSETDSLVFRKYKAGTYNVLFRAISGRQIWNREVEVQVQPISVAPNLASRIYVTRLFEFMPAPGQFINKNPGSLESAAGILGKKGIVSLGAWGGYIVLGFDHKVINTTNAHDIIIYNNAMASSAEPGVVWVMEDRNGNGLPDDIWYEIGGSASGTAGYIRNYAVTYIRPDSVTGDVPWKDNKGNAGVVKTNAFHTQSYFPLWVEGREYTMTGTCLPSSNINTTNPAYIISAPFGYGYADNTSGGDKIDLADAIDEDGKGISLSGIHFIKIQTGIQANMGWLGELSTEVLGVADASLVK